MIVDDVLSEIGMSVNPIIRHGGQLTIPGMRILVGNPTLMDLKPSKKSRDSNEDLDAKDLLCYDLPIGNQTWLAGKWTMEIGDVPLKASIQFRDFPASHV